MYNSKGDYQGAAGSPVASSGFFVPDSNSAGYKPGFNRPSPAARANGKSRRDVASADHRHNYSTAKMSKVNTQAVINLTETLVQFGATDFDNAGIANLTNETFVCQSAGIYTVKWQLRWENGTAATFRKAFLYVNSAIVATDLNTEPNTNFQGASVNSGSVDVRLEVGDIVSVKAYHNNGSTLALTNLNGGTWMSIVSVALDNA